MNFDNDSQVTLVNSTFEREQPLVLILDNDDVRNTVMQPRDGRGEIQYKTESDKSGSKISVYGPQEDTLIAYVETKEFFGFDKITFKGEKRRKVKDWISGYGAFQTL